VAYAQAIVGQDAALTLCVPGGEDVAHDLSEIMGVQVEFTAQKKVTQVHCRGGRKTAKYLYEYRGVKDCNALYALSGGDKQCKYGCLGLGSCIKVCPVDAISYDSEGLVWVNRETCIGCGKCIDVCPTGVMRFIPYEADLIVACNSKDKGAVTKKNCSVGCIGCKICEKQSPDGGYQVNDFLSVIDYAIKGEREKGADKCPTKCIIPNK
ncbi:MAG: 4Fe-4S binding protein, partial [Spirochaetales bacterium]|nr:4Fe-4S binding protein [Spirochaetales bacterium]